MFTTQAWAQHSPAKPVGIISPFAPGGGNNTLPLILAALTTRLGQQVVLENRPAPTPSPAPGW